MEKTLYDRLSQYNNILEEFTKNQGWKATEKRIKIVRASLIKDVKKYKEDLNDFHLDNNNSLQGILDSLKYEAKKDSFWTNFQFKTGIKKFNGKYSGSLLTFDKKSQGRGFKFFGDYSGSFCEFSGAKAGSKSHFKGKRSGFKTKFSGKKACTRSWFDGDGAGYYVKMSGEKAGNRSGFVNGAAINDIYWCGSCKVGIINLDKNIDNFLKRRTINKKII